MVRRAGRKRSSAYAALIVVVAAVAGCGSSGGGHFANQPRPPSPVNLTVYIDNHRVSVSPSSVGAGPIVFIVTNQASLAESLAILPAGGAAQPVTNTPGCPPHSSALACTGPISPMATAQVKVNLSTGAYTVTTISSGGTEAAAAAAPPIQSALLRIGGPRPSSSGQLLVP